MLVVFGPEKSYNVSDAISVHAFGSLRGEPHGYDLVRDVAQV